MEGTNLDEAVESLKNVFEEIEKEQESYHIAFKAISHFKSVGHDAWTESDRSVGPFEFTMDAVQNISEQEPKIAKYGKAIHIYQHLYEKEFDERLNPKGFKRLQYIFSKKWRNRLEERRHEFYIASLNLLARQIYYDIVDEYNNELVEKTKDEESKGENNDTSA